MPPAQQIACSPSVAPRRIISCSSVVMIRAPLAPRGWPSAIAPPLTFSRRATRRSRASTSSAPTRRPRSPRTSRCHRESSRRVAVSWRRRDRASQHHRRIGAHGRHAADTCAFGEAEATARHPGHQQQAAAPSEICEELPAVTRPFSGRKLVFSVPSFSRLVSRRMVSSAANVISPAVARFSRHAATGTGTISRSKYPPSAAAAARRWL